jgi:hypothetical protein
MRTAMIRSIIFLLAGLLLLSACSTKKVIKPISAKNVSFDTYLTNMGYKKDGSNAYSKNLPYESCSKEYRKDLKLLDKYAEVNIGPAWSQDFDFALHDNKHYIINGKCCVLKEKDRLLFSIKTVSSYKNDTCNLFIEQYSLQESQIKTAQILKIQQQRDAEYKKKQAAIKLKKQQERQRQEQQYAELRNRKGEHILHFFNHSVTHVDRYDRFFDKDMQVRLCQLKCKEFTKNETGYTDIQSALNDGWHFVTKLDVAKYDDYKCSCRGEKVILRK